MVTVEAVMRQVNNFFERARYEGAFSISGGVLNAAESLPVGSWVAIEGSLLHDGVHQLTEGYKLEGADEEFCGRVWVLAPPAHFLEICRQIAEYDSKNPVGAMQSESFGTYSYTRQSGQNGGPKGWQEAFASMLTPYRRMYTEVRI